MSNVREFFKQSQIHYFRLLFRDVIAAFLGMDMEQKEDPEATVGQGGGRALVIPRKTANQWASGESDPDLTNVMLYFNMMRKECPWPKASSTESVRTGIARTLTYILVFPPRKAKLRASLSRPDLQRTERLLGQAASARILLGRATPQS